MWRAPSRAGHSGSAGGCFGLARGTLPDLPYHAGGGSIHAVELGLHVSRSPRCSCAGSPARSRAHAVRGQNCRGGVRTGSHRGGVELHCRLCMADSAGSSRLRTRRDDPVCGGLLGHASGGGHVSVLRAFGRASSSGAIASAVVSAGLVSSSNCRVHPVARRRLLPTVTGHCGGSRGARESTGAGLAAVVLVPGTLQRDERRLPRSRVTP